ncbi:MAG TPA: SBBP repeat-containing protein [Ktedonobacteraceae bacterium]|nr:SBBP repeat-containing protein [Ktedonobacteraceae bacterium]
MFYTAVRRWSIIFSLFVLIGMGIVAIVYVSPRAVPGVSTKTQAAALLKSYGNLPLAFEANRGQADQSVKFLAHGSGYSSFLDAHEVTLALANKTSSAMLNLHFEGANLHPQVVGLDELPGTVNYFIGNDPRSWITNVPTYARVAYQNVYPGVNLVLYGNQSLLEYDWVIAPGANPSIIKLGFDGAQQLQLDADGQLIMHLPGGQVLQSNPLIYQQIGGDKQTVAGHYLLLGQHEIGFAVSKYNAAFPLIIDPTLSYSTYLGSSVEGAEGKSIAADSAGNAYITGDTRSNVFPVKHPFQKKYGAGLCGIDQVVCADAFVTKLNATGTQLIYSTYLGGSSDDVGSGIAVDASGNAYITGNTGSANFPTKNAFQPRFAGGTCGEITCIGDAFITKLSPSGSSLVYSTYLGGSDDDAALGIALDASNNVYVTGNTVSANFPTNKPFQPINKGSGDGFVTKLNAAGSTLAYSTFLGGSGEEIANSIGVDVSGEAYVTGTTFSADFPTKKAFQPHCNDGCEKTDGFVTKFNAAGTKLAYSTFFGGSVNGGGGNAGNDEVFGIAVDAKGNAFVVGSTSSTDFPVTSGAFQPKFGGGGENAMSDAFVTKFNPAGSSLVYSTYLGGSDDDLAFGVAIDASGNAYITGTTLSSNFPLANAVENYPGSSSGLNAFVTRLNASGAALLYSTYLGGTKAAQQFIAPSDLGIGVAVDASNNAYVTGFTSSTDFPTTRGAFERKGALHGEADAFISKIAP